MTKTWLITGCSTGFGRLLAQVALDRGDQVVATARDPATLSDMAKAYPKTARATALDVTKTGAAEKAVAVAMDALHRMGIANPARNFIVASQGALDEDGIPVVVLAKKTAFISAGARASSCQTMTCMR